MPDVTGRRADKLRDLVTVLKLRAVKLDKRRRTAKQNVRRGFDQSRFSGSCRSEKQKIRKRPSGAAHPSQDHLIDIDKLRHCFVLPNDLASQAFLKIKNF